MNPCRCGHLGDPALACSRAPALRRRLSGARFRGRCSIASTCTSRSTRCRAADLALAAAGGRVGRSRRAGGAARARRCRSRASVRANAELDGDLLEALATPDEPGRKLLLQAAEAMRLSARGYTRMLRVARTIADLAGSRAGRPHPCRRSAHGLSARRRRARRNLLLRQLLVPM